MGNYKLMGPFSGLGVIFANRMVTR